MKAAEGQERLRDAAGAPRLRRARRRWRSTASRRRPRRAARLPRRSGTRRRSALRRHRRDARDARVDPRGARRAGGRVRRRARRRARRRPRDRRSSSTASSSTTATPTSSSAGSTARAAMQGTDVTVRAVDAPQVPPAREGAERVGPRLGAGSRRGAPPRERRDRGDPALPRAGARRAAGRETEGTRLGDRAWSTGRSTSSRSRSDVDVSPVAHPRHAARAVAPPRPATADEPAGARARSGKTRCGGADRRRRSTRRRTSRHVVARRLHRRRRRRGRERSTSITSPSRARRSRSSPGKVALQELDLGAIARVAAPAREQDDARTSRAGGGAEGRARGEVSGELAIDRAQVGALAHAASASRRPSLTLARGAERSRCAPTADDRARRGHASPSRRSCSTSRPRAGFKGAVTVHGAVDHATQRPGARARMDLLADRPRRPRRASCRRLERATGTLAGIGEARRASCASPASTASSTSRRRAVRSRGCRAHLRRERRPARDADELRIARAQAKFAGGTVAMRGDVPLKRLLDGAGGGAASAARGIHLAPADGVAATCDADLHVAYQRPGRAGAPTPELPHVTRRRAHRLVRVHPPHHLSTDLSALGVRAKRTEVEAYDPSLDVLAFDVRVRSRSPLGSRTTCRGAARPSTRTRSPSPAPTSASASAASSRAARRALPLPRQRLRRAPGAHPLRRSDAHRAERRRHSRSPSTGATRDTSAGAAAGARAGHRASPGRRAAAVWRITLHAYGDADNLRVDMTSEPPLSQEDIVLLLTVGMTRAELDQLQASCSARASRSTTSATVSGADRAVKQAIPIIDDFRFGSAYSTVTGQDRAAGHRRQAPHRQRARERQRHGLAEDRELRSNIEWRLNNRLSVQGSYDNINDVSLVRRQRRRGPSLEARVRVSARPGDCASSRARLPAWRCRPRAGRRTGARGARRAARRHPPTPPPSARPAGAPTLEPPPDLARFAGQPDHARRRRRSTTTSGTTRGPARA